jgi:heme A synthase
MIGAQQFTSTFIRLALITALLTLGIIVFGGVVRVTDSGLGCGEHWPLCNGTIFPPLDNVTAWIEWLHRLFAVAIGGFGLATLWVAYRAYRQQNRLVLNITVLAAVLFTVQSALGALVVVWELPPTMVTLHLGTAMLLLGALLAAAALAAYKPGQRYTADRVTALAYLTAALSLLIILTGALVRGSGATLACTDWPLCNGSIVPFGQGQLALIHMIHRFSVVALGISLLLLIWFVLKERQDSLMRGVAIAAGVVYLSQAGIGALFVWTSAAPIWGATHVGMAAATWGLLVMISAMEWLGTRQSRTEIIESSWKTQSLPLQ